MQRSSRKQTEQRGGDQGQIGQSDGNSLNSLGGSRLSESQSFYGFGSDDQKQSQQQQQRQSQKGGGGGGGGG